MADIYTVRCVCPAVPFDSKLYTKHGLGRAIKVIYSKSQVSDTAGADGETHFERSAGSTQAFPPKLVLY
jgi:hypothetical protein